MVFTLFLVIFTVHLHFLSAYYVLNSPVKNFVFAKLAKNSEKLSSFIDTANVVFEPSNWEKNTRKAIVSKSWTDASTLAQSLESTILPSGRNAVYVISETCRRSKNMTAVVPLLRLIPKQALIFTEGE